MPKIIRDIEPWFADGLSVHASVIHGLGLHATRAFVRGSDILRFGGCLFHLSKRRSPLVMPSTTTPLSEDILLAEPSEGKKDLSDYLNHSCDPNIDFRDAISLVAIRSIGVGDEIVIDYAFWECDRTWKLMRQCHCGSPKCRKSVTGEDWKTVKSTDRYLSYFSPFLRRRIRSWTSKKEKNNDNG